ncbi:hypothetical protein DQ226_11555 [Dietzia maris]|uniref:Luciferase-like domain-containing protein n=1 Tax=Dietzia maris TaxID=37915 RepID=A0A365P8X5_9ACTN|nr:hypothetical protein DQ226_11555 [Dietzia maris]
MILAQHGHELARVSGGRFALGICTQVQAHITRRYGEPWYRPAARCPVPMTSAVCIVVHPARQHD